MKTLQTIIFLGIIAIIYILVLPLLLNEREFQVFTDEELRQRALYRGMYPTPKNLEELKKQVETQDNKLTYEKVHLGKKLFFDTKLSNHQEINCATCHMIKQENKKEKTLLNRTLASHNDPNSCKNCHLEEQSGTDRLESSIGDNGEKHPYHLNTISLLNASLAKYLTWSGDFKTLEAYIKSTFTDKHKFNLSVDTLIQRLEQDKEYPKLFKKAFPLSQQSIQEEDIYKAIASYVRTLVTRGSYDEFLDGDNQAISQKAKQGLANFLNFGCKGCHAGVTVGGQSLQKFPLRQYASVYDWNVNIKWDPEFQIIDTTYPFENRGNFYGQEITNLFRVPVLRNVTKTSPYFHNGAVDKIDTAVNIMGKHQLGIQMSPQQRSEIIAFLKTLEGDIVNYFPQNRGVFNENNKY